MKKDKGTVEYIVCLMLMTVSVLMMLFCFRIRAARVEKSYVEDALATANLAAAVIDTDIYGETEMLIISDSMSAYQRFQKALKTNLNLDENFMPNSMVLMENAVKILEFHIYNVNENTITHIVFDENGTKSSEVLGLSGVTTPDGTEVESTTIYSKIEFDVKGYLTQRNRLTLDNSVDIVKN